MTHLEGSPWSAAGSFGQWLGRARKAGDLTRDELAEQIGCSNSTLYKLEAGLQRPSKHLAEVIGRRLGVASAELAAFVQFARGGGAPTQPAAEEPGGGESGGGLPAPLTAFVGREADLAAAIELLATAEIRILTIGGPGGIGKTRLALHLAAALERSFAGGAIFVSLAAIRDPSLVPLAVARALGLADLPGDPPLDALKRAVQGRQLLLILDNFEHLLAAAPAVIELLQTAPRLKIVVTSRSRLRVSGEHLLALQPLGLPAAAPSSPADPAAIGASAAVRLFVSRAQAIDPRLRLDAITAPPIAAICRRLEGIPLAIELAAARLRMFPIETLAARLDSRLALLTRGQSDLPARQQSLRATLQWSYDLLAPDARRVLHWLSLFVGGGRLEALGAASGDPAAIWLAADPAAPPPAGPPWVDDALLESLETLIDGHLVASQADGDAQPRYGMLETIREYLGELRPGPDEAPAMLDRFGAYHLAMAAAAAPALSGPHQAEWLNLLDREHDNVRAALQGYLDAAAGEQAIRLAGTLGWFWSVRGHLRDGLRWLTAALALSPQPSPDHAQALIAAARLSCDQGDYAAAAGWLDACLAECADRRDLAGRAYALNQLGILERKRGNYPAAAAHLTASLELLAGLDDANGTALVLNNLGIVARARHADAEAAAHYRRSLGLFRERGNYDGIAMVLNNLGVMEKDQGRYAEAAALYGEALELFRRLANRQGVALALGNLGLIAQRQGRAEAAAELHREALLVFADLGDRMGVAKCRHSLAELAGLAGRHAEALALYRESLALCGELGFNPGIGLGLYGLAATRLGLGQPGAALWLWCAAAQLAAAPEDFAATRRRLEELCAPAAWVAARAEVAGLDCAELARRALDQPAAPA